MSAENCRLNIDPLSESRRLLNIIESVLIYLIQNMTLFKSLKLWKTEIDFAAPLVLGVLSGLGAAIAVSLGIFILTSSQPRIVELGRATGSVDYRALGESKC